jgi:hypothetical protein
MKLIAQMAETFKPPHIQVSVVDYYDAGVLGAYPVRGQAHARADQKQPVTLVRIGIADECLPHARLSDNHAITTGLSQPIQICVSPNNRLTN